MLACLIDWELVGTSRPSAGELINDRTDRLLATSQYNAHASDRMWLVTIATRSGRRDV